MMVPRMIDLTLQWRVGMHGDARAVGSETLGLWVASVFERQTAFPVES